MKKRHVRSGDELREDTVVVVRGGVLDRDLAGRMRVDRWSGVTMDLEIELETDLNARTTTVAAGAAE